MENKDKNIMQISEKGIIFYEKTHNIKRCDSISKSAKKMTDGEWDSIKVNKGKWTIESPDGVID
ncbi:hypothetical protein ES705_45885 [subsurface metagenome]